MRVAGGGASLTLSPDTPGAKDAVHIHYRRINAASIADVRARSAGRQALLHVGPVAAAARPSMPLYTLIRL